MRAMLLNKIAKKEKELDCLYLELKDYIDSLTISNKEVKDFVHSLLIYIEQPSCKRILKQFMENYWFALNVNRRYPNCPDHFSFSINNSDNIVRISNEKSSKLASLNSLDLSSFTNKDNEIITAITRKVYELSITKDENGIITEIKFETY